MKHTIFIWSIIYFFITTQSCYMMEKKINPSEVVTILPPHTIYLYEKNIYNYNLNTIGNLITGESKKIEETNNYNSFEIHPNRTKIAFFDFYMGNYNTGMQIYDIEQPQIIKPIKPPLNSAFNPVSFSLFNNDLIVKLCIPQDLIHMNIYNYDDGNAYIDNLAWPSDANFILHPKKMILCEILKSGHIKTYNYYKHSKQLTIQQQSWQSYLTHSSYQCIVNHQGFIAINDPQKITISILHLDNVKKVVLEIKGDPNKKYIRMLFYPKGSILTTITQKSSYTGKKKFIQYWDIPSKRCFETIELSHQPKPHVHDEFYFSRNGKKIIFHCKKCEKSCVYYVPWQVRYKCVKDKCLFLIVLAKRHNIPNDIARMIMHLLKKW